MTKRYGIDRVLCITLTFPHRVTCPKEAQRRFHSLRTAVLSERYVEDLRVFERHTSGGIHYHLYAAVGEGVSVRGDFDFNGFLAAQAEFEAHGRTKLFLELKARYVATAPEALRAEWHFWNANARKYGFGRVEVLPVKTCGEAVGKYYGKYIGKSVDCRKVEDKGVRLVAYSRGCNRGSTRFSWRSPRNWLWRKKLAVVAGQLGFESAADFSEAFGPKWAYHLADLIMAVDLAAQPGGVTYPTQAHYKADHGPFVPDDLAAGPVHVEGAAEGRKQFEPGPVWNVCQRWPSSYVEVERPSAADVAVANDNAVLVRRCASQIGPWNEARKERRYNDD